MGHKHRRRTFVVENQTKGIPWGFVSRHKSAQLASDFIRKRRVVGGRYWYRIVDERWFPERPGDLDRYPMPYILLEKPKKIKKPKPRKYRWRPNRWDIYWRVKFGEWVLLKTLKKRRLALAEVAELEASWYGTGMEVELRYRREDKSGRTYYRIGEGFI